MTIFPLSNVGAYTHPMMSLFVCILNKCPRYFELVFCVCLCVCLPVLSSSSFDKMERQLVILDLIENMF